MQAPRNFEMSVDQDAHALRFGRFLVLMSQRQLVVDDQTAKLGARAFDVLQALIERRDRVVHKDELLALVWPGLVVEENNLQVQISALRKILGPSAIATIPGRGYRFTLSGNDAHGTQNVARTPAAVDPRSANHDKLPRQLTTFIGRTNEITAIASLLAGARLLTLIGSGGCGKTRLALQVASAALQRFSDGVFFVDLAPLAEAVLVPQTIATAVGVVETSGKPIAQSLVEHLEDKRVLLIVDNCEHLLEVCASTADVLIRRCHSITIIATSRQALGLSGEQTYRVPPLSLPDGSASRSITAESLFECESAQLFIDRARLVRDGFRLTDENAPALASLCTHLDGMPLAIELAAARVRTLSVEEIDSKLDQRFRLLTGGSKMTSPRQRTLRSLMDWSYDLLRESEQKLLQRLSIFAGGSTLDATESVCAGDGVANAEILDLMTSLCDKSLAVATEANGHIRYRLLETVRQYAREKLNATGGDQAVRVRHVDHFVSLAEHASLKMTGPEGAEWLMRLADEHDNLRASLEASETHVESRNGLRLCGALVWYWTQHGHVSEGREWCRRLLATPGNGARTAERANTLHTAGMLALYHADMVPCRERFAESLAIMREIGDGRGVAGALTGLGSVSREAGEFTQALAHHAEALAIRRELQDSRGVAHSLMSLGGVMFEEGNISRSETFLREGLSIAQAARDQWTTANILYRLGLAALLRDDVDEARTLLDQTLAMRRGTGDRRTIAGALAGLGLVAFAQEDNLTATALQRESLSMRRDLGDRSGVAYSLEAFAEISVARGDCAHATRIWGAVERLRDEAGLPLPPVWRERYDRALAAARAAMRDDASFERGWRGGRALTIEQAMDLAMVWTG